jgi:hypothetical protein
MASDNECDCFYAGIPSRPAHEPQEEIDFEAAAETAQGRWDNVCDLRNLARAYLALKAERTPFSARILKRVEAERDDLAAKLAEVAKERDYLKRQVLNACNALDGGDLEYTAAILAARRKEQP